MAVVWIGKKPPAPKSTKEKPNWPQSLLSPMKPILTGPNTTTTAPWNTKRTLCTTGPAWKETFTAIESPSRLWKPETKGQNPHWLPENWTVIMELKSVQALVEMYQAVVAAIFGFTTTVPSPILVVLTIMRTFPKSLDIGITNLPISAAKFFYLFFIPLIILNLIFPHAGFDPPKPIDCAFIFECITLRASKA